MPRLTNTQQKVNELNVAIRHKTDVWWGCATDIAADDPQAAKKLDDVIQKILNEAIAMRMQLQPFLEDQDGTAS